MQSDLINNRDRAKQILAFDGMQYEKCRPTDIDFSLDFQGNVFIMGELKGQGAPLTLGQKIHLEGLVKAIRKGGKDAYAILAHHDTPNTSHDVRVSEATVFSVYDGVTWDRKTVTVDQFIKKVHNEYLEERAAWAPRK